MGDYEVGYGKPPKAGQFQKGRSGNPRGRPKGSKDFATLLKAALDEMITVNENGRPSRRSKKEVMTKVLVNKAVKGDLRAWMELVKMSREAGIDQVAAAPQDLPLLADHAAIIERALAARMASDADDDVEEAA
jgi:hypothetical protein